MCGVAGAVGEGGALRDAVARMSMAVAHRGPDDAGIWHDTGIVLAHRRLSIIDLSPHGHQPMLSSCGRYVIALNGEIYNYLELRAELMQAGETFRSQSDTEVLLVAFRRWGPDCLAKLNGMWAFVIWDRREQRVFAGRDRFGKKPLYYRSVGRRMYFASEIKALLEVDAAPREVDVEALADFCAERVSDHTDATFFRGIKQLPPAHYLWWADGSVAVSRYWTLELRERGDYERPDPEKLAWLIEDAVRLRLRADTPVGCLLSGGIDSSSVTCLAARGVPPSSTLRAFSTVHDPPVDEAKGIESVVKAYPQIRCEADQPTAQDFWRDLDGCLWHQDEPFGDASMLAHFRLMRVVRGAGIKVLLSGQGADEVFGGYPGHLWHYLGTRVRIGELRALVKCWRAASTRSPVPLSTAAVYSMPHPVEWRVRRVRARLDLDWLAPEFRETTVELHRGCRSLDASDPSDRVLHDAIAHRTIPAFLHYEDRNSMAFGVECRVPFLDYRLVQYAFSLPPAAKFEGGRTKALLRSAMAGVVPADILHQSRKQGYPAPLSEWLRAWDPDRRDRCIKAVASCALIHKAAWRKRLDRFERGDDAMLPAVWRGIVVALWHRRFIDQAP